MQSVMQFLRRRQVPLILAAIAVLAVIPLFIESSYVMGILSRILMYAVLAGSLNVINGYSGQFNIGHAGYYLIGAYTEAILATSLKLSFWIALPIAGIVAAGVGYIVCLPTLKLKGIYLAIVTLGFSEIIRLIALNWTGLTGGPNGIKGIPSPNFFGMAVSRSNDFYYIFLGIAIVFFFVTKRVVDSRIGRAWISIREDELAAKSLGVESSRYKSTSFMYGAFWAGIAGAAFAPYFKFIDSTMFTLDEGFNILSMVIIGGQGTLIGPIVGATLVNFLTEVLRPIAEFRMVAYAILIIAMMWLRPQGLVGASNSILAGDKIRKDRKPVAKEVQS